MPKNNSASSSDKSESCSTDKSECEPKCEKDECCPLKCPCFTPEELICKYRDAVVNIQSEFILIGASGPTAGTTVGGVGAVTGGTPPGGNVRIDILQDASGFFINGHYIITTASAVLMPPALTSVVNRYPFFNPVDLTDPERRIQNTMVRASRILVTVHNVNGKGHSFVYEADLVGVDGAGNIAVLRINYKKQWNFCNPCIEKCHPFFTFGKSRAAKDGEKIYLIGDYVSDNVARMLTNGAGLISEGIISDHRYTDYTGFIFPELVLVSAVAYTFSTGIPIINCQGEVIAMQTIDVAGVNDAFTTVFEGYGYVAGIAEFFMRRVIKTIIKGQCSRKPNCHLELINDPAGSFYRYKKGYLGISYELVTGATYDSVRDWTSGIPVPFQRRFRLSDTGEFLNSPACKEIVGILIFSVAGINQENAFGAPNGAAFAPAGTGPAPLALGLPLSPLFGRLQPGDIITHINGIALGDLRKQIAPALITWRLCAGDQIDICYRRGGNVNNNTSVEFSGNYDNLFTTTVVVEDFPQLLDYPYFAIDRFPLLSEDALGPGNGFDFPGDQRTGVQFPMLSPGVGGSLFAPLL